MTGREVSPVTLRLVVASKVRQVQCSELMKLKAPACEIKEYLLVEMECNILCSTRTHWSSVSAVQNKPYQSFMACHLSGYSLVNTATWLKVMVTV